MDNKIFNIDVKIFKLRKDIAKLEELKYGIRAKENKAKMKRNKDIIKLHKKGYSLRAIGKTFKLSHERINQIIYDEKVKKEGYL